MESCTCTTDAVLKRDGRPFMFYHCAFFFDTGICSSVHKVLTLMA